MREYLKKLREEHGMSMQEVADRIKISRQYYQLIEAGERQKRMDITLITAFSSLFGVPIEEIIRQEAKLIETRV